MSRRIPRALIALALVLGVRLVETVAERGDDFPILPSYGAVVFALLAVVLLRQTRRGDSLGWAFVALFAVLSVALTRGVVRGVWPVVNHVAVSTGISGAFAWAATWLLLELPYGEVFRGSPTAVADEQHDAVEAVARQEHATQQQQVATGHQVEATRRQEHVTARLADTRNGDES